MQYIRRKVGRKPTIKWIKKQNKEKKMHADIRRKIGRVPTSKGIKNKSRKAKGNYRQEIKQGEGSK